MSDYRIANRYAKSLYQMASSENTTDAVYSDLKTVVAVAEGNRELRDVLRSPVIAGDKKLQILKESFKGANERTQSFFGLVINKRREAQLIDISKEYLKRVEEDKGIARATVTSAVPLSDDVLDQIKRYLKGAIQKEDIQLTNKVDDTVIGGMVIKYEDRLLDLSVARELKEIRKTLINN